MLKGTLPYPEIYSDLLAKGIAAYYVYYVYDFEGCIVWVGHTNNPYSRHVEHRYVGRAGELKIICVLQDRATAVHVEALLTRALKARGEPLKNIREGYRNPTVNNTVVLVAEPK